MKTPRAPISVVIPTLQAGGALASCLEALVPGVVEGLVREAVVSDGGSRDATPDIARASGARLVQGSAGRGGQLARGADAARGDWLLFLHADTRLRAGWTAAVRRHIEQSQAAAVFRLRFDTDDWRAGVVAAGAMARTRVFKSPYGDQGLLISRAVYDDIGGFSAMPLFEDVDIVDRLVRAKGRKALVVLDAVAETAVDRYRNGYARRVVKNAACLALYRAGVAPHRIRPWYRR